MQMVDCNYDLDIECNLKNSATIKQLKAKDQQLQTQVDNLNDSINKSVPWGWVEWKWIKQRLDDVEACCEDKQDKIDQINTVISEIGDNITLLKGMSTRQDEKINSLKQKVIKDEIYFNFEDWVENVYLPQCDSITNKYSEWDIYINVNQDVAATNATYVCVKKDPSAPCSANDWQEIYYSAPADVMTILWIDPVKVTHPYKHEWVVSLDPRRLADMIWGLQTLDLSKVEVTLWEIYFEPVIKESIKVQENLEVWNTTTTKELNAEIAYIDRACIREMICDTDYKWTQNFENIVVNNFTTENYTQEWWTFNINNTHVKIEWDHVEIPNIEWDTHFHDHIYAPNINIENKTETTHLHVHHDTHLDWHVYISWDMKFEDQRPWHEGEVICLDNVAYNSFTPSYWFFKIQWSWVLRWWTSSCVIWLWSDWILTFHESMRDVDPNAVYIWTELTQLIWDEENLTAWVSQDKSSKIITIYWSNPDYAWIYQISMQMVVRYWSWINPKNVYAHRAWFVVYWSDTRAWRIYDDKHAAWDDVWTYKHTHTYTDRACECWTTYWNNTSEHSMMSFSIWNDRPWYSDFHANSDDHYTYTVNVTLPINEDVTLAPYIKVSSWVQDQEVDWIFQIMNWEWVSWWNAVLSVVKIANVWQVYNYHC